MLSTTSSGPEGGVVSARKKSRMAGFSGAESERELVNVKPVQVEVCFLTDLFVANTTVISSCCCRCFFSDIFSLLLSIKASF